MNREDFEKFLSWYEEQAERGRPGFRRPKKKKVRRLAREAERLVRKSLQEAHPHDTPPHK